MAMSRLIRRQSCNAYQGLRKMLEMCGDLLTNGVIDTMHNNTEVDSLDEADDERSAMEEEMAALIRAEEEQQEDVIERPASTVPPASPNKLDLGSMSPVPTPERRQEWRLERTPSFLRNAAKKPAGGVFYEVDGDKKSVCVMRVSTGGGEGSQQPTPEKRQEWRTERPASIFKGELIMGECGDSPVPSPEKRAAWRNERPCSFVFNDEKPKVRRGILKKSVSLNSNNNNSRRSESPVPTPEKRQQWRNERPSSYMFN